MKVSLSAQVFIVHAGIPCREISSSIYHIGALARRNLRSTVAAQWDGRGEDGRWRATPRSMSIIEDLLWSDPIDPHDEPGSEALVERNMMRNAVPPPPLTLASARADAPRLTLSSCTVPFC
jgi:hypothetical protein